MKKVKKNTKQVKHSKKELIETPPPNPSGPPGKGNKRKVK